jgi:hypothetical protein
VQLVLLVLGALLLILAFKAWKGRDAPGRTRLTRWLPTVLTAAALLFVLYRTRAHWLVLVGAAVLPLLRLAAPLLLRLLPGLGRARARRQPGAPARGSPMSRTEALEILGLEEGASRDDVLNAYRTIMKRIHPDHGGPTYLAAKVNQAKDVLLP